ncbi:MAG: hypothetical protein M3Z00_05635 [Actinomycetota bacterium]|nr:hypothetical protein [Actinomycetota bacterium]
MDAHTVLARCGSAVNPLLGRDIGNFTAARNRFVGTVPRPRTVAVIGLTPGEGRSSVAAVLALSAAGWSNRRVLVLDTVAADRRPCPSVGAVAGELGVAGRSVTALLGGDTARGGLNDLLDITAAGQMVARSRLQASRTPGAAVPVLSLRAGGPAPAPRFLMRTLALLRQRADLVVIDTPAGPESAVFPDVLASADHFVLVARGDGDVDRRLQSALRWLDSCTDGRAPATAAIVSRSLGTPSFSFAELPVVLLPRDEGLRRRRVDRLGRQATTAGLTLAAEVARPAGRPAVAGRTGTAGLRVG